MRIPADGTIRVAKNTADSNINNIQQISENFAP